MKLTNEQFKTRTRILGHDTAPDYVGFEHVTVDQLEELVKAGLANPDETQNESPTIAQFIAFMTKWPGALAHGYTIGGKRDDGRVSVEGLFVPKAEVTLELLKEFSGEFHTADEFDVDGDLRCWWD